MDLALIIFLLALATEFLNWVGKSFLIDSAFNLYQLLSSTLTLKLQRQLKGDILRSKLELDKTSSQDEFAKWAKLRRKLDKLIADLEKTNGTLQTSKAAFTSNASRLIWILTTGFQFGLVWWYRKRALFYLPNGWLGGGVGWWFSFPSAPKGAISSAAWSMVCKRSIKSVEEIVRDFLPSPPDATPSNPFAPPTGSSPFASLAGSPFEEKPTPPRAPRQRKAAAAPVEDYAPQLDLD
ncbi:CHD5-like protein-domain-containing protein [Mrakia frigida]|uniref:GET complex subunit GET1 n=1 Tax=Mrakia frigida TaxID=29902 RepID=UPI003FCC0234